MNKHSNINNKITTPIINQEQNIICKYHLNTHYKKIWNYIQLKFVRKTLNLYVKPLQEKRELYTDYYIRIKIRM